DDRADPWRDLPLPARYGLAEDPHVTGLGAQQAEQGLERGGLAGAVRPEEAVDLTRLDEHVEPVERDPGLAEHALVGLHQTVDFEYRSHQRAQYGLLSACGAPSSVDTIAVVG